MYEGCVEDIYVRLLGGGSICHMSEHLLHGSRTGTSWQNKVTKLRQKTGFDALLR